jgi:hypothetical protein
MLDGIRKVTTTSLASRYSTSEDEECLARDRRRFRGTVARRRTVFLDAERVEPNSSGLEHVAKRRGDLGIALGRVLNARDQVEEREAFFWARRRFEVVAGTLSSGCWGSRH